MENVFGKVQHPFMIKSINKVNIERVHLNTIKIMCKMSTANTIVTGETKNFTYKACSKARMHTLTVYIQQSTGSFIHKNQPKKRSPNLKCISKIISV